MKKLRKYAIIIFCICFAAMIGIYFGMSAYFKDHFLPNTVINDIDVSRKTVAYLESILQNDILDYSLTIYDKDGNTERILPTDYGLIYESKGEIQQIKDNQNPYLWFMANFRTDTHTVSPQSDYDQDKLIQHINSLPFMQDDNMVEPIDAYIEKVDGRYVIIEEICGSKLDKDAAQRLICEAIDEGTRELDFNDYDIYYKPAVTSQNNDLQAQATGLNNFVDMTITHEFGSRTEVLTGEKIHEWAKIDDNLNITVDENKVADYVYQLAIKYNTFGNTRKITSTSRGYEVDVIGGHYGWIINQKAETKALVADIQSGISVVREPVYEQTANSREEDDTGSPDTYVEIDLSYQSLYFYVDGVLKVQSPIVSGTKGVNETQEGTYSVMYKATDEVLEGEDYESPVDYFIPFYTNVGLHDASWRTEFGGDIYKTSGSHGCINMPRDAVERIFNIIEKGTIVYCYY